MSRADAPNPCVLLAVDPARRSGWAIIAPHTISPGIVSGTRDWAAITAGSGIGPSAAAVADAQELERRLKLPLIVVAERTGRVFGRRSRYTATGLGEAWGRWAQVLADAGHPASRTIRVDVATWRRELFGGGVRTRDEWKATARWYATTVMRAELGDGPGRDDEAEAICIAAWARRSPRVRAAVGKRVLARNGVAP